MNDIAQTNLTEPAKVDWDNYGASKFTVPPPALDASGKPITYFGVVGAVIEDNPDVDKETNAAYLQFKLDPVKITAPEGAGYEIRFTRASARPYTIAGPDGTRIPKKGNPNKLADYLRAAGSTAKPMTNAEYRATVKAAASKQVAFTIDWEAYNKDTGEAIRGYTAFPEDPARPGQRKAILKQGDFYNDVDRKGVVQGPPKQVQSEVLFANARLRFFQDAKKGQK